MKNKCTLLNNKYSYKTKASDLVKNVDLTNKTILITGATSGIGYTTTKALIKTKATIIVAVRNIELARKKFSKYPNIIIKYLDLSKYESIKNLVNEIKNENIKLDYLINNAGLMGSKYSLDEYGLEYHFKVNYFASYLLTTSLIDYMNENSRIICLSSVAHKWSRVHFEDINFKHRKYSSALAYAQSKTCNILFVNKLSRLLKDKKISCFAVHPGVIALSNIWTPRNKILKFTVKTLIGFLKLIQINFFLNLISFMYRSKIVKHFKSTNQGAATTVFAVINDDILEYNGAYLEDCNIYPVIDPKEKKAYGLAYFAHDAKKADLLFEISDKLAKEIHFAN